MISNIPNEFASWLTINRECNLRCKWCYTSPQRFQRNSETNMSLLTVEKSINLFKDLAIKRVILIGGEPTIHPNFITIVEMIKKAGLIPVVITNGIKFKDDLFLKKSLNAGIAGITTSLKGSSNRQYKELTGRSAFTDVMNAIKNIVKSGVDHNLSITIGESLFENFNNMLSAVIKSETEWFSMDMERPTIINNQIIASNKFSPLQMADFFIDIYPKIEACGMDFVLKISIPFCLFPENFIEMLIEKKRIVSGCHIYSGRGIIIDPIGNLLPCNHFCDNILGSLDKDFIAGHDYIKFRERPDIIQFYKTLSNYPDAKCKTCHYWQYCGAGCRLNWLYYEPTELVKNKSERR